MKYFGLLLVIAGLLETAKSQVFEVDDAIVTIVSKEIPFPKPIRGFTKQSANGGEDSSIPSCVTFNGRTGSCLTIRECYPFTKIHQSLGPLETWVIGTMGTCHYVKPDGRQVYGVCCQRTTLRKHLSSLHLNKNRHNHQVDSTITANSRIVNGANAFAGEFPYMVGILDSKGNMFCGGSLVDNQHVLTAAHCFMGMSATQISSLNIVMGIHDLTDSTKIVRRVKTYVRHNMFDSSKMLYDVALLTLNSSVPFSSNVAPVCLNGDTKINHDGTDVVTAGWGRLSESGKKTTRLQKVTLQIKSLEECRKNLGSKAPGGVVDHYICAWAPSRDSCSGDSGGPLIRNGCQVGIVSWGIGCATETYGVYTRISSFQEWIDRNRARY